MDSFDKLKKIWDDTGGNDKSRSLTIDKLNNILSKRTKGPVEKLKASLKFEIGAVGITLPVILYALFHYNEPAFLAHTIILLCIFLLSMVYYMVNYRRIKKIWKESQDNIRDSVNSTLLLFNFFRRAYLWLNLLLFPFALYLGYMFGFGLGSGGRTDIQQIIKYIFSSSLSIIVSSIIFTVLYYLFYLFVKWFFNLQFGRHMHELRTILKELDGD